MESPDPGRKRMEQNLYLWRNSSNDVPLFSSLVLDARGVFDLQNFVDREIKIKFVFTMDD